MKNKSPAMLVLFLFAAAYYSAPFTSVRAQDPPPPPRPLKDYFPNTWDEFAFPAGQFRIRFPDKPAETVANQGTLEVHTVQHKGLITYRVSWVDYKKPIDDPGRVKEMLQGLKAAALNSIREKGIQVIVDREVVVDANSGIFVHLEVQAKEVIRVQWVAAGSRLYTISAETRKGSARELEGKDDFEKVAMSFINSFHVVPVMPSGPRNPTVGQVRRPNSRA